MQNTFGLLLTLWAPGHIPDQVHHNGCERGQDSRIYFVRTPSVLTLRKDFSLISGLLTLGNTLELPSKIGKDWRPGARQDQLYLSIKGRGCGRQQYFEIYIGDLNMQLIVPASVLSLDNSELSAISEERTNDIAFWMTWCE